MALATNGDELIVAVTAGAAFGGAVSAALEIGTGSGSFDLSTCAVTLCYPGSIVSVDGAGGDDTAFGDIDGPLATIQAGIDAAALANGDDVLVADGTYNELINFNGKAITVHSINGAAATTIDGGGAGSVVTCDNAEGPNTVFAGFTVTGGPGTEDGHEFFGRGMYNVGSSPTVTDCIFSENSAANGGGMNNFNISNPTVTNTGLCGNTPDQIIGTFTDGGGNFIGLYCPPPAALCPTDTNGDGVTNVLDLIDVLLQFGKACP